MTTTNHARQTLHRCTLAALAAWALAWSTAAPAHCDTLDGPVVAAARQALATGDVKGVLVWVRESDEADVRRQFAQTLAVRKLGTQARELSDAYFFETLVRVHRAGEGADYTGLKPAGHVEPPIAAADLSLQTGRLEPVADLVAARMREGLHRQFDAVMRNKRYAAGDLAAGRAFTSAYVEYTHYVERLYNAAQTLAPEPAGKPAAAPAHQH